MVIAMVSTVKDQIKNVLNLVQRTKLQTAVARGVTLFTLQVCDKLLPYEIVLGCIVRKAVID